MKRLALVFLLLGISAHSAIASECTFTVIPSPEFIDNRNNLAGDPTLPAATTMVRVPVDPATIQCQAHWYPLLRKTLNFNGPTYYYLLDVDPDSSSAKQAAALALAYLDGRKTALFATDIESTTSPGIIDYGVITGVKIFP